MDANPYHCKIYVNIFHCPRFQIGMDWYDPLQEKKGGATKVKVPDIGQQMFVVAGQVPVPDIRQYKLNIFGYFFLLFATYVLNDKNNHNKKRQNIVRFQVQEM